MAMRKTTSKRSVKGKSKRNIFDPVSLYTAAQGANGVVKVFPSQRTVNKFIRGNPAIDVGEAIYNSLPEQSLGHIEFTPDGIERFVRGGFVYMAFSNTPVFPDGYRMGTPEASIQDVAYQNPARFNYIKRRLRNPSSSTGDVSSPTSADVSSPTSTSADVSSPTSTKTATDAYTGRNITVTGGAGAGATNVTIRHQPDGHESIGRSHRSEYGDLQDLPMQSQFRAKTPILQSHFREDQQQANPRRKRRYNPEAEANAIYEEFHGVPPSEMLEITEHEHVHGHLAGIGDLVCIVVKINGGKLAGETRQLNAPDPDSPVEQVVHVACNENKNQLYLVGGDQTLDVKKLGFRDSFDINHDGETFEATELKDLMVIGEIHKLTYRTQKEFDKFEDIDYFHKVGEDTRVRPFLLYDTLNDRMKIAGGEYTIHAKGIVN